MALSFCVRVCLLVPDNSDASKAVQYNCLQWQQLPVVAGWPLPTGATGLPWPPSCLAQTRSLSLSKESQKPKNILPQLDECIPLGQNT